MKNTSKIFFFLLLVLVVFACGPKKDTIIRRNYQALVTKYNVLFNGKEALNQGIEELNENYKDDWFERLPIEPIAFEEDKIIAPTFSNGPGTGFNNTNNTDKKPSTPFEKAEEKAVKAIQKHGMNINGIERNRQIDDAYLLLGKARYYQQRFIPAIEAFNYVIAKYPNANLIAETKIWRAKANIRNDFEDTAIESMKLLLIIKDTLEADWSNEIKEKGYTAMAMAYVKSDSLQKAKESLKLATRTLDNTTQAARNLFILGQMYADENKKDSASQVFKRLVNFKKAPYKYRIHANIELARNTSNDSTSAIVLKTLDKLIKDRDNRPYLDELYYQKALLHERNDSIGLALSNYKKSLRAKDGSDKQKTFTFEKLGNLNFKDANYQLASAYYDSILQISTDSLDLRIRRIKRKHKNLASLINFENIVDKNDSIIRIASMTQEEQKQFFEGYVAKIKKADEDAAQLRLNQLAFGNSGNSLGSSKKGSWYFYNSQSLNFGKTEFIKNWGVRKLEDNWRWSDKATIGGVKENVENENLVNARYDVNTYLKSIPSRTSTIDTLKLDRNQALYELGLIYKEQFKNNDLAIKRLERVNKLNPAKELILPINWHLYQIYNNTGNKDKATIHKKVILEDYAETKFAQIINNPNADLKEEIEVSEVESTYKDYYYLYKDDKFEEAVTKINEYLPSIQQSELLPKFELLKALAIGKYKDKEAYKKSLEFVSVSYGNTEQGKRAKAILDKLTSK